MVGWHRHLDKLLVLNPADAADGHATLALLKRLMRNQTKEFATKWRQEAVHSQKVSAFSTHSRKFLPWPRGLEIYSDDQESIILIK